MKKLIIVRGLPGSGKSTLALELANGDQSIICTADDYMVDEQGNYCFDPRRLGYVHQECNLKAHQLMSKDVSLVILANTSIKISDMKEYFFLAYLFDYEVKLVEPKTSWMFDIDQCFEKNVHKVPLNTLQTMKEKYVPSCEVIKHYSDLYPSIKISIGDSHGN